MSDPPRRTLVLADFNGANLAAYLTNDAEQPQLVVDHTSLSSISSWAPQELMNRDASWDVGVVWTRPETVSSAFARFTETGVSALSEVLSDVDVFAGRIRQLGDRCASVIGATWQPPQISRAFTGLAMKEAVGIDNTVMRMNLRLAERLDSMPGFTLLDSAGWLGDDQGADPRLWYSAKVPFRNGVFRRATRDVKAVLRAIGGRSRKLIVLDLDDTLWGGIVGEVGWEGLRLGGHDAVGEAYVDFQRTLKRLTARGVLLAIASKNDEEVALTALALHPEMMLRPTDFVARRINWHDKADNIASLVAGLNLGLSSVVFIDDNAAERARVRAALPDVLVPDWPTSPLLYVKALLDLRCFDTVAVTAEDRQRSAAYRAEAARAAERCVASSPAEWLSRLGVSVEAEELAARNLPRAAQLLNKTNQMNLSTRRLTAAELDAWLREGQRMMWTFRVSDRFGDSGLTGLTSLEMQNHSAMLVDFILSCRVFGRRIEEVMLHHVTQCAANLGARELIVRFSRTRKNAPCLRFLESSHLTRLDDQSFQWNLAVPYPLPPEVELRVCAPAAVL